LGADQGSPTQAACPSPQALDNALLAACQRMGVQPVPAFVEKAHQLYEMTLVRHGLMLVGYSYGAKTSIYRWAGLGWAELG
jgi:dynein heavy chain